MGDSDHTAATRSSAKPKAPEAAPAPKPKTGQSSVDVGADQILNPAEPELAHADESVLDTAITEYIGTTYDLLQKALDKAVGALREPPKPPEVSLAMKLLAELVDTLTEFALDYVSGGLFEVAKHTLGHVAAEALHTTAEVASFKGANAVGNAVEKAGEPGEKSEHDRKHPRWFNPAAKNLVEEFAARQEFALRVRRAHASVLGAQVRSAIHKDRSQLTAFATNLQALANDGTIGATFADQTVIGWMNFTALASVGKERFAETEPLNFSDPDGALGPHEWRDVSDGVIDVEIAIPETLWGTRGFWLKSMTVAGSQGAARTLKNMAQPLLGTPVLRRIWLSRGDSKLDSACAMVLYPSGSSRADSRDRRLMALGMLAPVDLSDTSHAALTPKIGSGEKAPDNALVSAREASLTEIGASVLTSWLGTLNTESIK